MVSNKYKICLMRWIQIGCIMGVNIGGYAHIIISYGLITVDIYREIYKGYADYAE